MKTFKPHVKLVDGLWHCYGRKGANSPIMIVRHFRTLAQRMQERQTKLDRMRQDREAGRRARMEEHIAAGRAHRHPIGTEIQP